MINIKLFISDSDFSNEVYLNPFRVVGKAHYDVKLSQRVKMEAAPLRVCNVPGGAAAPGVMSCFMVNRITPQSVLPTETHTQRHAQLPSWSGLLDRVKRSAQKTTSPTASHAACGVSFFTAGSEEAQRLPDMHPSRISKM